MKCRFKSGRAWVYEAARQGELKAAIQIAALQSAGAQSQFAHNFQLHPFRRVARLCEFFTQ